MSGQDTIAVIGAGVIGAAVARDGRRVVLLDRAEPGVAGASFGNAVAAFDLRRFGAR
jgi:glycine/D-amino acid oxidase-like deaminating enzyme